MSRKKSLSKLRIAKRKAIRVSRRKISRKPSDTMKEELATLMNISQVIFFRVKSFGENYF